MRHENGGKRGDKGCHDMCLAFSKISHNTTCYTCTHTHTPVHTHTLRERLACDSWQQSSLNALHERFPAPPLH